MKYLSSSLAVSSSGYNLAYETGCVGENRNAFLQHCHKNACLPDTSGGGATSRLSGKVGGSGPRLHQKGCTWTFCYTLLGIYGAAWVWGLAGTVALVFEGMEVIELAGSNFSFA